MPAAPSVSSPPTNRTAREIHITLEARETSWEIAPGRTVAAWTYQGSVPGPTIIANVGDTLVAHLVNHLPEPTVVHWHGLRIPAPMDGTESVQRLVQPGESFEYRFVLPDAGTFWYHSHTNETVQVTRGLHGAVVVRGPDEPTFDADRILVLGDANLDGQHSGQALLINGHEAPEYEIAAGQVERWRIVNASSGRYVLLSLGGMPFRIIGGDGGLCDRPVTATETLLTPGDRVELAVGPFEEEGAAIAIESLPYPRTSNRQRRDTWGTLRVGTRAPSVASIPAILRKIEPLVPPGPMTRTRTVRLGARTTAHGYDWLVNDVQYHRDAPVKVGDLQVWEIVNETDGDHPFHLHGFFFQVVAVDGVPIAPTSWEDTINVVGNGQVTIAFRPDDRPGRWMYHCHILEHHAGGMMGHFDVVR